MVTDEKPLVTFALFAYNQEKYIREAIEGAFSQTYEPLQIVLSDDCSSDSTFEIMQFMAGEYRGPHKISLNRNIENQNIGKHVNTVNALALGEMVVAAAGDDISIPCRTSEIVNAWLATGRKSGLLHSGRRYISEDGAKMRDTSCQFLASLENLESAEIANVNVAGATEAWDPALFAIFGDFRGDLVYEDCALTFRSLLAGRPITYVDKPLVHYRYAVGVSADSSSSARHLSAKSRRTLVTRLRIATQQKIDDLQVLPNARLAEILAARARRQDVAISFEDAWPSVGEIPGMLRSVGAAFFTRMVFKRLLNQWRDKR